MAKKDSYIRFRTNKVLKEVVQMKVRELDAVSEEEVTMTYIAERLFKCWLSEDSMLDAMVKAKLTPKGRRARE